MLDTISVYMLPGMTKKFTVPDYFVQLEEVNHRSTLTGEYSRKTPVNGFVVDNEDIGTIEAVPEEPAVYYTHRKYSENFITYYSRTGEMGKIFIVAVMIHDHASVVTGGPAFGTYFTDDETLDSTPPD